MSVLDGAGTVHSMLSYELSECVVMFQQLRGVASTQVVKPCAISALKALALDDAKHRETHPARSRLDDSIYGYEVTKVGKRRLGSGGERRRGTNYGRGTTV